MRRAAACLRLLSLFVSIIWNNPDFISIQGQTNSSSLNRAICPPPRGGSPRLRLHVHVGEPEFRCRRGVTLDLHRALLVNFIVSPEGGFIDRWGLRHGNRSFEETVGVKALPPSPFPREAEQLTAGANLTI